MSRLSVIAISSAFGAFWTRLGEDLGAAIDVSGPDEFKRPGAETVAIILAAGGAEQEAARWLDTHAVPPELPTWVIGTDPERRTAMRLVTRGASEYFALPDDLEIFRSAVAGAVNAAPAPAPAPATGQPDPFAGIVGGSAAIRAVLDRARRLLPHRNASALILGDMGTGKELLARAIHAGGPRRAAPFVAVNCWAIPEHLIESELFGHERGAFTDAYAAKPGLFELADCGTLFLDEIGDLAVNLQAKRLRALEDKVIRRVGGTRERVVDVRVLAATNGQLAERMGEGASDGTCFSV